MYQKLRKIFVDVPFVKSVDIRDKIFIITGCSVNSIGFETAKTLASWGGTIIITTRKNIDDTVNMLHDQIKDGHIDGHILDLTDSKSVIDFSNWYIEKYDRLDVW